MKKLLILSLIAFGAMNAHAQVTDEVKFENYVSDKDCDFANNFDYRDGFTQQDSAGIGNSGCIKPFLDGDDASYYRKFTANTMSVSISFQYWTVGDMNELYPCAVFFDIWNKNGYVINTATLEADTHISFYPYLSITTNPGPGSGQGFSKKGDEFDDQLENAHWYTLTLKAQTMPGHDSLITSMYMYDLGIGGTAAPTLLKKEENDILGCTGCKNAYSFQPGFIGKYGCAYLDNFVASGTAYLTGIKEVTLPAHISMPTIVTTQLPVKNDLPGDIKYSIYSISGAVVREGVFQNSTTINIADLPAANYIIKLADKQDVITKKFVKQ